MKYFASILALIMSASLLAQNGEKCLVGDCQNGYGELDSKGYSYKGNFVNGAFQGEGTMILKEDSSTMTGVFEADSLPYGTRVLNRKKLKLTYVGGFNYDFAYKGEGTVFFNNGDTLIGNNWDITSPTVNGTKLLKGGSKYVGELDAKTGKYHGYGTFYYTSGAIYKGDWEQGKQTGQCDYTASDGGHYVGGIEDGKYHGKGTYEYKSGDKYEGGYNLGNKHGKGTYTYNSGAKFVGEYDSEKKSRTGTYTYASINSTETGTWVNEKKEGLFDCQYYTGAYYKGNYENDKKSGQGEYKDVNGAVYVGEFKNDQKHGTGTVTYPGGNKYEGEFKFGLPHGNGKFFRNNILVYEGEFDKPGVSTNNDTWLYEKGEFCQALDGKNAIVSIRFDNGDYYVGTVYSYVDYTAYWGGGTTYVVNQPDGTGIMVYHDGTVLKGNWKKAAPVDTVESYSFDPTLANLWYQYGEVLRIYGGNELATFEYSRALDIAPKNTTYLHARGVQYALLKKYDDALGDFDAALAVDNKLGNTHYEKGMVYYNVEKYNDAIKAYDNAIKYIDEPLNSYYYRGMCYQKLNNHKKAISDFDEAVKIKEHNEIFFARGVSHEASNNKELACQDFKKAKELGKAFLDTSIKNNCE